MIELNYVKGKWYWKNPFEDNQKNHIYWNLRCDCGSGLDRHILYVHEGEIEDANAHLIAAAPDMYEALKAMADKSSPINPNQAHAMADAALAKAEGK